jgi:hypothetical protein
MAAGAGSATADTSFNDSATAARFFAETAFISIGAPLPLFCTLYTRITERLQTY